MHRTADVGELASLPDQQQPESARGVRKPTVGCAAPASRTPPARGWGRRRDRRCTRGAPANPQPPRRPQTGSTTPARNPMILLLCAAEMAGRWCRGSHSRRRCRRRDNRQWLVRGNIAASPAGFGATLLSQGPGGRSNGSSRGASAMSHAERSPPAWWVGAPVWPSRSRPDCKRWLGKG